MKRRQRVDIRWFHFFQQDPRYRNGTERERRMIELKISAALAVNRLRTTRELTQQELAQLLGVSQARVSRLEQVKPGASLEQYVEALLALGASDTEIAGALDAGACFPVQKLREHAAKPYYRKPLSDRGCNPQGSGTVKGVTPSGARCVWPHH